MTRGEIMKKEGKRDKLQRMKQNETVEATFAPPLIPFASPRPGMNINEKMLTPNSPET